MFGRKYLMLLVLAVGMAIGGSAWAGITDGLVGYWDFNGNANDKSGNGNNGLVNGATLTADRFGNANSAYLFDGTKGSIVVPSSPSLNPVNQLTIAFWFKQNGVTSAFAPIIYKGGTTKGGPTNPNREYSVWLSGMESFFYVASAGDTSGEHTLFNSPVPKGWVHFVAKIDRKNHVMKTYINGVLDGQQSDSYLSFNKNNNDLVFGGTGEQADNYSYFNGALDDVRIYNHALSDAEIQQLYSQSGTAPTVSSVSPTSATLDQLTTFTVQGQNLTSGMDFTVGDCEYSNTEVGTGSSTQRTFECTPRGTTGTKTSLVKTAPNGTTLYSFTVNITSNVMPPVDQPASFDSKKCLAQLDSSYILSVPAIFLIESKSWASAKFVMDSTKTEPIFKLIDFSYLADPDGLEQCDDLPKLSSDNVFSIPFLTFNNTYFYATLTLEESYTSGFGFNLNGYEIDSSGIFSDNNTTYQLLDSNSNSVSVSNGVNPVLPVNGGIELGFDQKVSWASARHNGIDYYSSLGDPVRSVGYGKVYAYTKATARRFGWIHGDERGTVPAIWIQYTLSDGSPVYVVYGHTASSWSVSGVNVTDKSSDPGCLKQDSTGKTFFDCIYTIDLKPGDIVQPGQVIGYTAPFYNGNSSYPHLHMSVFKPKSYYNKKRKKVYYYQPPSSGWGYSKIKQPHGEYVNPEVFLTNARPSTALIIDTLSKPLPDFTCHGFLNPTGFCLE